jgi:hypothetical protein
MASTLPQRGDYDKQRSAKSAHIGKVFAPDGIGVPGAHMLTSALHNGGLLLEIEVLQLPALSAAAAQTRLPTKIVNSRAFTQVRRQRKEQIAPAHALKLPHMGEFMLQPSSAASGYLPRLFRRMEQPHRKETMETQCDGVVLLRRAGPHSSQPPRPVV